MNWDKSHTIILVVSAAASLVAGLTGGALSAGIAYGRLQANVDSLETRIEKAEKPRPNVALGDVCLALVQGFNAASPDSLTGEDRQERFAALMERMRCFSGMEAAAASLTDEQAEKLFGEKAPKPVPTPEGTADGR